MELRKCPVSPAGLFILLIIIITLLGVSPAAAQRGATDSAARARQAALAAMRASQQQRTDSIRAAQQVAITRIREARERSSDSLRSIRQRTTDSLAAIRKYKDSRRYKDSVARVRTARLDETRNALKERTAALQAARKKTTDSLIAARQAVMAPIREAQQRRTDSLAAIRKYRESKRFRDSVAVVTKVRKDSVTRAREDQKAALVASRKAQLDAIKEARKKTADSLTAVRKVRTDSLAAVKKTKTEASEKRKKDSETLAKAREKQKEQKFNLALELKIKQKRKKFTNEKFLKKKWAFPRRPIQNTFTHYNYYFNASRKMDEAELNMQRIGKDDYDSMIALSLYDPSRDSGMLAADMDSIIQKASIGIQLHDPRTKWADDLYLLLGEAYFYKGRYEDAEAVFKYVVTLRDKLKTKKQVEKEKAQAKKEKTLRGIVEKDPEGLLAGLKHQSVHNDALLWLSRTYSASGKYEQAEAVLDLLASDNNLPDDLKGRVALEKGVLALARSDRKEAADNLFIASADKSIPDYTRRRAAYLGGQLLQENGRYADAATSFDRVTDLHPKVDMEFYARKARAYNIMMSGQGSDEAVSSLRRMLNDNKFAPYYEQVYFILGQLSANAGNRQDAEKYLAQSVMAVKTTKKQKAQSFAALGHLYFQDGRYGPAKRAYDSVLRYSGAVEGDQAVDLAIQRGRILDKVATPAEVISSGDSLLALGALSEKDRRAAVRRHLRALQDAASRDTLASEDAGVAAAARENPGTSAMSWYFANATLMQQGVNDFRRKWGTRPNVDNWRRASALMASGTAAGDIAGPGDAVPGGPATDEGLSGMPTEEFLLSRIPVDPARRDATIMTMQRAYVDLATAYLMQFEDYQRSRQTLDTLSVRYPEHPYAAEALYVNYLIALRQSNAKRADSARAILLDKYNGTEWASRLQAPESGVVTGSSAAALYEEAYTALQDRRYGEALSSARAALNRPNAQAYALRIRLVQASALAGSQDYDAADTLVRTVLNTNPEDAIRLWGLSIQDYIRANRPAPDTSAAAPASAAVPAATVTPAAPTAPVDTATGLVPPPVAFTYKPTEKHAFVFIYNATDSRALGLRAAMADFNTFKYPALTLSSRMAPLSPVSGIIVTEGFANAVAARNYLRAFSATTQMVREYQPKEYTLAVISESNLKKLESDRNTAEYLAFFRKHYR